MRTIRLVSCFCISSDRYKPCTALGGKTNRDNDENEMVRTRRHLDLKKLWTVALSPIRVFKLKQPLRPLRPLSPFLPPPTPPNEQELLDTLRASEAAENRDRTQRTLVHQAELPTSGRGSAKHWRHSNVLDGYAPHGDHTSPSYAGISGGRQHPEARRHALVFQRLRDSVRKVQEDHGSAGPVRDDVSAACVVSGFFRVNEASGGRLAVFMTC